MTTSIGEYGRGEHLVVLAISTWQVPEALRSDYSGRQLDYNGNQLWQFLFNEDRLPHVWTALGKWCAERVRTHLPPGSWMHPAFKVGQVILGWGTPNPPACNMMAARVAGLYIPPARFDLDDSLSALAAKVAMHGPVAIGCVTTSMLDLAAEFRDEKATVMFEAFPKEASNGIAPE